MPRTAGTDQSGMRSIIVAIVATALCTAGICYFLFTSPPAGKATIDGSTDETFKTSIDAVKRTLTQPRQQEFEQAMTMLATAVILTPTDRTPAASLMALSADPGAAARKLRARVHGMTASE